jgi:hypothetical protein
MATMVTLVFHVDAVDVNLQSIALANTKLYAKGYRPKRRQKCAGSTWLVQAMQHGLQPATGGSAVKVYGGHVALVEA